MINGFFTTVERFNTIDSFYKENYWCKIIDTDHTYVLGEVQLTRLTDYSYLVGEKLDRKVSFRGMQNLWIDPSGNAYFVPFHGHAFTAALLGFDSVYTMEALNWIHLSYGGIQNYGKLKPSDRQYDTVARYCEDNEIPMFRKMLEY